MKQSATLLTRDEFREGVFARDRDSCVICGSPAQDAHHIIERRLFVEPHEKGGYFLDNGASLCGAHHIQAETTELDCFDIREAAGIKRIVLPDGWYPDQTYSKWGDVVLPNLQRMKGPLFDDESVQKILKAGPHYGLYTDYVKYPRTYHLPWSEGKTKDDKTLADCSIFEGREVIVTEKMDGENSTLYPDYYHARSIDGRNHASRSWIKRFHAEVAPDIFEGWRWCGENLFAVHSIRYDNLYSYFRLFSMWNEKNECVSWDEMEEIAAAVDHPHLVMVPVLYRGVWDESKVRALYDDSKRATSEGYVVRLAGSFHYRDFKNNVAKFVRKEHIGTSHHWFFKAVEQNGL